MKSFALLALLGAGLAQAATGSTLPAGAEALGYTDKLFDNSPTLDSVSETGNDSTSQWYAGQPGHSLVQNLAQREMLSTVDGQLAIPLGSAVLSVTRRYTQAALPLLDGAKGFYVEFTMHLSSNDPDHFYGLYLLPAEHNIAKSDHFAGDPAGFERWTEIDVSESGYDQGSLNTVINWWGNWPQYSKQFTNNYGHDKAIDFTKEHRYGVSYDPQQNVLQWYLDDQPVFKASTLSLSKQFHYEMVMDADTHGANQPYTMYIHNVRAYSVGTGAASTPASKPTVAPTTTTSTTTTSTTVAPTKATSTTTTTTTTNPTSSTTTKAVVQQINAPNASSNGATASATTSTSSSGGGGSMDTWALAALLMGVGAKLARLRFGPAVRGSF